MFRLLLKNNTQGTVYSVHYIPGREIHRTLQPSREGKKRKEKKRKTERGCNCVTEKACRCVVILLQHCVHVLLMCNLEF
jgi:hypothetical protein